MRNPKSKRPNESSEYTPENIQDLLKCMKDPIYFFSKFIKVKHPKKGLVPLELYQYQERMVDALLNHKDVVMLCSRQMGKTTIVAMYFLWVANFRDNKELIIASKNMDHAVQIMDRIKTAYDELPHWLKAGAKFNSRTMLEFDNGSKIKSEATSERTGRGSSPAAVMLDELAFASPRIQEEMWASLAPSLSTGGQFIVTSTPNGDTDLFASLWRGANAGTNGFFPVTAYWHEHPDRGQAYYDEMVGKLGPVKAAAELDCIFVSSDALLINSLKLVQLKSAQPHHEDMGFKFWKADEDIGGQGKTYLVGVDPATGTGKDFSVIQVFEFPSLEQVAEWRSNDINIPLLYAKVKWVLEKLSAPVGRGRAEVIWTFERNGIGEALAALYTNDEKQPEHAELYCDEPQTTKLGVFTSGKKKVLACLQLKSLVEKVNGGLKINSAILLEELKNFVAKGGTYEAKSGATDDAVMATIIMVRLLKRLAEYNDQAFKQVNEYVAPDDNDQFGDEPVPFLM
ncbi:terminase large subunit domain-containing protein [Acinetobacter sp.]|uniref:terminase large subunit domain-containing protein n=1 Tax=Acinetobacter sp. TaxID=472 RepID=UPI00388F1645